MATGNHVDQLKLFRHWINLMQLDDTFRKV